jgi:hypothetical protein
MKVIKSKRKSKCLICRKEISGKYKVEWNSGSYLHLSCGKEYVEKEFNKYKRYLKELKKQKYKRNIILEKLEC